MFEEPIAQPAADSKQPAPTVRPMAPRGPRGAPPRGPPGSPDAKGAPPGAPNPAAAALMNRTPRPQPPRMNPPGIPEGQPLPPQGKPEAGSKAPAPVRAPPRSAGGGRAAPEEAEGTYAERQLKQETPLAPTSEPPLLRVKKAPEVEVLKRREREMPEFESSDEDEDAAPMVKQPLPFGVLKQAIPKTRLEREADEARQLKEAKEKEAREFAETGLVGGSIDRSRASTVPSSGPKENKLSAFVPAAPKDIGKHFDDSKLGQGLTKGRISIRCMEGHDIRRKDDKEKNSRIDPFIKFRLGAAERHPWKQTAVRRKQDSNPQFENELVYFDVTDPAQYVFDEDVQLCIELWTKSTTRNDLIGTVTMSVVRFFKQPFVSYTEKVPIYYPGATKTPMKLMLEIVFEEARSGLMQVTLFEASGLRNIDPMGQQDPYVQLSLGRHYKKRSKTIKGGGVSPYFEEEDLLMWIDQENWVDNLLIQVLDEDTKEEKPIGSTEFSLLPYMKILPDDSVSDSYDLFYQLQVDPKDETETREETCGEIILRVRFMPAGSLRVFLDRAKDLAFPEGFLASTRMDPYVSLSMEGKAVKMVKRTPADKDGGNDPVWQDEIRFEVVDQYLVDVEVFNQGVGKDVPLGTAQISLLNVFRSGKMESWISLKQKKTNGGVKEVGCIFVRMEFLGPPGIAYPQYRPEMDSFDDQLRIAPKEVEVAAGEMVVRPEISTVPDDVPAEQAAREAQARLEKVELGELPAEFTETEILAAFKFIDLDHNNFVGAAEIRHILVCMGEMITDEEIDMMISMVDMDGDGQVSLKEFRTLVLHPNPGVVDMHKEISKVKDLEGMKEKQAMAGKVAGLDLTAFQRQKEITVREEKKKMIVLFVVDNEADFEFVKRAHSKFLELPLEKRVGGRIRFQEFCTVADVEPIQEYKLLHAFYDSEEMGDMDVREFLLSMMNFVDVDREERIRYSFDMFDELKTGYIAQAEVEEILKGNHMLSVASVRKKADTIMRQANSNKTGSITMNEFVVVSKKFPNILLPAVGFVPTLKSSMVLA